MDAWNLHLAGGAAQQLAERLKSVECASVIASGNQDKISLDVEQIAFTGANLFVRMQIQADAALAHERISEGAHHDAGFVRWHRGAGRYARMAIATIAEFMSEAASEEGVLF
jgi:siroheme synthase